MDILSLIVNLYFMDILSFIVNLYFMTIFYCIKSFAFQDFLQNTKGLSHLSGRWAKSKTDQ